MINEHASILKGKLSARQIRVYEQAKLWHQSQKRKCGEPVMNHLRRVAETVSYLPESDILIPAALLHDVLEDCNVSQDDFLNFLKDVYAQRASDIMMLVVQVTNVYEKEAFPALNRKQRKTLENMRLGSISATAQALKIADTIDNLSRISLTNPGFARVYLRERADLLQRLLKAPSALYDIASAALIEARRSVDRLSESSVI